MDTPARVASSLEAVKSHGVEMLDTARIYNSGRSEESPGLVDASHDFRISTKTSAFASGSLTEDKILSNRDKSLQALKQDKVDIYYLQDPDRTTPIEEQCRAISTLYKRGKLERLGNSTSTTLKLSKCTTYANAKDTAFRVSHQDGYSPVHRKSEQTPCHSSAKLGIDYYAFSPLAGGLLAEKESMRSSSRRKAFVVTLYPLLAGWFLNETIIEALEKRTKIGEARGTNITLR